MRQQLVDMQAPKHVVNADVLLDAIGRKRLARKRVRATRLPHLCHRFCESL
jgi:hypothetical protein